jgi:hypothetical protein
MTDYKYIRAWGYMMGSFEYYVRGQVDKARRDNAPADAIYRDDDGTWHRYANVTRADTRMVIDRLMEQHFHA